MIKTVFESEAEFEAALVDLLVEKKGWKGLDGREPVLRYKTEAELVDNWARILFENNNTPDRLNGVPLTKGEKAQLLEKVIACRTPNQANQFINGGSIQLKRDAVGDEIHFGSEVSLSIYDRNQIAGGKSVYQIAVQPQFAARNDLYPQRRGDLMLLINGLPVIHIELKKSGVSVMQAANQIIKYSHEHIFTGFFSLIQVFVAMQPEEALYFANPGDDGDFSEDFMFHWEDDRNQRINRWDDVAEQLLSIPMAHKMIGFYTVADESDGILKVLRSYQYWAAEKIVDRCIAWSKNWEYEDPHGGYVWHTTGSGKTLTSFKAAQLIAMSKRAEKVVFLVDRIELGTQSLREYKGFASAKETVNATEDTEELKRLLISSDSSATLIVTSIQKMNILCTEAKHGDAVAAATAKRMVVIVDECHRSVFGDMMMAIKEKLPHALLFGFTGTPIVEANAKKGEITTADIFGGEICRYTIADGIRDKSVLEFDLTYMSFYDDEKLREVVALYKAKAETVEEAMSDERKRKVFMKYMYEVPMVASYWDEDGKHHFGIEGIVPKVQYELEDCKRDAVEDVVKNWDRLSMGGKYHALFAVSSIYEAIEYYDLFKELAPQLKVSALFDPNIDANDGNVWKEDRLAKILDEYNKRYSKQYKLSNYTNSDPHVDTFKRDVANRLAHKRPYSKAHMHPEQCLDILIVVDQLLTGYDSKWLNTLYMDKVLSYEHLIQAFSRTNRVLDEDKPFGSIRCYRMPHTMKDNVHRALELYAKGAERVMFVPKLKSNLEHMNALYLDIVNLFIQDGEIDLSKLPESKAKRGKFALQWREFNDVLVAAKVQGYRFSKNEYRFADVEGSWVEVSDGVASDLSIEMVFNEDDYLTLALRYKELFGCSGKPGGEDIPFDIDPTLMKIDTTRINSEYLDEKFETWVRANTNENVEAAQEALAELHNEFVKLSAEDQQYAEQIIRRIQTGETRVDENWSLFDYINHAKRSYEGELVAKMIECTKLDYEAFERILIANPHNDSELNHHGMFEALIGTVDMDAAKTYMEQITGQSIKPRVVYMAVDRMLREFILSGMFDVDSRMQEFL